MNGNIISGDVLSPLLTAVFGNIEVIFPIAIIIFGLYFAVQYLYPRVLMIYTKYWYENRSNSEQISQLLAEREILLSDFDNAISHEEHDSIGEQIDVLNNDLYDLGYRGFDEE